MIWRSGVNSSEVGAFMISFCEHVTELSFDKGRKSLEIWVLNFKGRFYTMVFVAWLDELKLKFSKAILASDTRGGICWRWKALLDPWPRNYFTSSFPSSDFKWMFLFPGANELQPPAFRSHNLILRPLPTATALTPFAYNISHAQPPGTARLSDI